MSDITPKKVSKPKFRFNLDEDHVQRILDRRRHNHFSSKLQRDQPGDRLSSGSARKPRQEMIYIPRELLVQNKEDKLRDKQSSKPIEHPERWIVPKRTIISSEANLSNEKANIAKRIRREKITSRATRCLTSANEEIGQIGPVRRPLKHDPHLQGLLCKN